MRFGAQIGYSDLQQKVRRYEDNDILQLLTRKSKESQRSRLCSFSSDGIPPIAAWTRTGSTHGLRLLLRP